MARKMCKCGNAQAVRQGGLCNRCFAEQGVSSVAAEKFPVEVLKLKQIEWNAPTQTRKRWDSESIKRYAEIMGEAQVENRESPFPPLTIFFDGKKYWPADGFHRHEAALRCGIETFRCEIHPGGQRDALLHACGANSNHGVTRTTEDIRNAIEILLYDEKWGKWSSREISRRCNCSHGTVNKYRDMMPEDHVNKYPEGGRRYNTKHGTESEMRTDSIGARKKESTSASLTGRASSETCQDGTGESRTDDLPDYDPELAEHVHLDAHATTTTEPEPNREAAKPESPQAPQHTSPTPTTSDMPMFDDEGHRVPDGLRDVYGDTWIVSVQQDMETLRTCLKAARIHQQVRDKANCYPFMNADLVMKGADMIANGIQEVIGQLEHGRPVSVCPACMGNPSRLNKCKECGMSGLVNRTKYDELTPSGEGA